MTARCNSVLLIMKSTLVLRPVRVLLLATCILLITLVLLEITVRLWGHAERHIYDPIYTSFDRTRDIPYVHKPNLTNARARGLAIINTDSLGLRAITAGTRYGPKQENEYRIAIVGDSVTFGEGIPRTEDTFLLPPGRTGLFDRISKELRRDQMTFLDLSPLRNEFAPEQFRASQFDGHPSAAVHHSIGETLAEYILYKHMKT